MATRKKKAEGFVQDDSMTDADKLAFAMGYLTERFEAQKQNTRPSARLSITFPTIEDVFDLAKKL